MSHIEQVKARLVARDPRYATLGTVRPRLPAPARTSLPLLRARCAHEGRIITPCHSCGSEQRHVRDCELHGTCTRVAAGKEVDRVCATCPDYEQASGTV